jgi:hypothetical protein
MLEAYDHPNWYRSLALRALKQSLALNIAKDDMRPNSALVTDACVAALRASYSAAQRGR